MKKPLIAIAIALFGTPALASPAQDLFDQATFYLGFYYNGATKLPNYRELRKQYQPELDKRCAGDTKCGYDKALEVINQIVATLNDPFTSVINDDFERLASGAAPARPRIGLLTRAAGDKLVVARTMIGEPAWDVGVERGDVLQSINGKAATLETLVSAELEGKAIALGITRNGQAQSFNLTPKINDEGQKPYSIKTNAKNTMLIHVPDFYWGDEIAKKIHVLVRKANQDGLKNVVLDLRDSDTGFDSEAMLTARAFTEDVGLKYKSKFLNGERVFELKNDRLIGTNPATKQSQIVGAIEKPQLFKGNVAVLVNRYTRHAGEIAAYLLQKTGKVKVIGEITNGQLGVSGGLPSLDVSIGDTALINGQYINLANDRIYDLSDKPYPSAVTPDIGVTEDPAALATGKDAALEKAFELLGAQ